MKTTTSKHNTTKKNDSTRDNTKPEAPRTAGALILSPKVQEAVIPAPTKNEIIEAMAQREYELRQKRCAEASQKMEQARKAAIEIEQEEARAYLAVTKDFCLVEVSRRSYNRDDAGHSIRIELYAPESAFTKRAVAWAAYDKALAESREADSESRVTLSTLCKAIRAKINAQTEPGKRIATLLSNPDSLKVIDESLKALADAEKQDTPKQINAAA